MTSTLHESMKSSSCARKEISESAVKSADTTSGKSFMFNVHSILALDSDDTAKRVAFDCEGINLCRLGTVEIVSICYPTWDVTT